MHSYPCLLINRALPVLMAILPALAGQGQAEEAESLWPDLVRPAQTDKTSARLLDLNLKARGGEALASISSIEKSGLLIEGQVERTVTRLHARPASLRESTSRRHLGIDYKTISGFDGEETWRQRLLPEKEVPDSLPGLEARLFLLEALVPFLSLDWEELGIVFAYQGEGRFAGRPTYRVHAWGPNDLEFDLQFDQESFFIINYSHPYRIGDRVILVDRTPTRMVRAGGVFWENGVRVHIRGKAFRRLQFGSVLPLPETDTDAFSVPVMREFWLRP